MAKLFEQDVQESLTRILNQGKAKEVIDLDVFRESLTRILNQGKASVRQLSDDVEESLTRILNQGKASSMWPRSLNKSRSLGF